MNSVHIRSNYCFVFHRNSARAKIKKRNLVMTACDVDLNRRIIISNSLFKHASVTFDYIKPCVGSHSLSRRSFNLNRKRPTFQNEIVFLFITRYNDCGKSIRFSLLESTVYTILIYKIFLFVVFRMQCIVTVLPIRSKPSRCRHGRLWWW